MQNSLVRNLLTDQWTRAAMIPWAGSWCGAFAQFGGQRSNVSLSIESNQYKATSHDGIGEECKKQISNQPENHPILATSNGGGCPEHCEKVACCRGGAPRWFGRGRRDGGRRVLATRLSWMHTSSFSLTSISGEKVGEACLISRKGLRELAERLVPNHKCVHAFARPRPRFPRQSDTANGENTTRTAQRWNAPLSHH